MERKSYYGGKSDPSAGSKTAEHVHMLHRIADSIKSDYETHAKTLRTVADSLKNGNTGEGGVKEKVASADRKGRPRD